MMTYEELCDSKAVKQRSRSLGMSHDPCIEMDSNKRKQVELKRGRLVDKTKEPPFLRGHSASNILGRNNSLTKEEKQELNAKRRDLEEKENLEDRNLLKMVVAGDVGGAAKYRKTMSNQKRKIRRRHTVGGTKDFAQWEAMINDENSKRSEATKQDSYVTEGINMLDEAAEVAAMAAASRILERQQRQQQHCPEEAWGSNEFSNEAVRGRQQALLDRRLSLPESAMNPDHRGDSDNEGKTKMRPYPSLLESQV